MMCCRIGVEKGKGGLSFWLHQQSPVHYLTQQHRDPNSPRDSNTCIFTSPRT